MPKKLRILQKETPLDTLSKRDLVSLFSYLRDQIMNHSTYKWSIKNYENFVSENNLKYKDCYDALKESALFHPHNKTKGFKEFLIKIERFNKLVINSRIIIDKSSRESFLIDLIEFKHNHFEHLSKKEFFNFINSNFDTGLKEGPLRNFYYEQIHNLKSS